MAQRIGVDVGGTNVKIALVSDKGKIIYSNSIPTRAEMGYEYTINSMKDAIRDLLKDLEDYINNYDDDVDPLVKMALIHYQFEIIHPFYDGNGRTGRILNVLYLVLNNLLDSPILYLSNYINKNKSDYYRLFTEFRNEKNYEDWIVYILKGVEETSKNTIELIKKFKKKWNLLKVNL